MSNGIPHFLVAGIIIASPLLAQGQSERAIEIRVSSSEKSCFIDGVEVHCGDVGAKLKAMRVPADSHIHLRGDSRVSYDQMHSALESLVEAGYSTKVGFVTTR